MFNIIRVINVLTIIMSFHLAASVDALTPSEEKSSSVVEQTKGNSLNIETSSTTHFTVKDVEFVKKYVDYNILTHDTLVTPTIDEQNDNDVANIICKMNVGEYDDAIASLKQKIDNYLSVRTSWGTLLEATDSNPNRAQAPDDELPLSRYVHLAGLAFELKGDYQQANRAYQLVFESNLRERLWTEARLIYEESLEHNDDLTNFYADQSFMMVCGSINGRYDLPLEEVIEAVEYVKAQKDKWKKNPPNSQDSQVFLLVPDGNQSAWFIAQQLYQIRIRCAQFVCPNLLYKYRVRDNRFTHEGRVETVKLIRDSYDSFMRFMEKEYAKAMQNDGKRLMTLQLNYRKQWEKDGFTRTMVILRKIKELPY